MSDQLDAFLGIFHAVTGLTMEDVLKQTLAETPEEATEALLDNMHKMDRHLGITYTDLE